jgi:hypothetical protein
VTLENSRVIACRLHELQVNLALVHHSSEALRPFGLERLAAGLRYEETYLSILRNWISQFQDKEGEQT